MSPENLKTVAIALVFITGFFSAALVLYPMARGWARRGEPPRLAPGAGTEADPPPAPVNAGR